MQVVTASVVVLGALTALNGGEDCFVADVDRFLIEMARAAVVYSFRAPLSRLLGASEVPASA